MSRYAMSGSGEPTVKTNALVVTTAARVSPNQVIKKILLSSFSTFTFSVHFKSDENDLELH